MTEEELYTKFIKTHNISDLIEEAKRNISELNPICIPSYKFRNHAKLIKNIEFDGKVFLFVYEDDFYESGYSKYEFPNNVEIVKIKKTDFEALGLHWRGICSKRAYIQYFMEKKKVCKKYFMIDDDVVPFGYYSAKVKDNKCKSCYLEKISINDICKVIQFIGNSCPEYKLLGTDKAAICCQFYKFNKLISKNKLVLNLFYFNDCPIKIDSDNKKDEDYKLYVDCIRNGIKTGVLPFISINPQFNDDLSTLPKESKAIYNFLEYPQWCKLSISKDGKLGSKLILSKIRKGIMDIENPELVELCKNGTIEEVKQYVSSL